MKDSFNFTFLFKKDLKMLLQFKIEIMQILILI